MDIDDDRRGLMSENLIKRSINAISCRQSDEDQIMSRPEYELLAQLHPARSVNANTRIRIIEEDDAEGDTAAAYQYFRDVMGRQDVPGILKCFGTNPTAARLMVDMGSTLLFSDGYLTRRQKEMIATYISSLNACPYCLDSHGFFLTVQGTTIETVQAIAANILEEAEISAPERELLRFTGRVNSESFKITDLDVRRLRELDWQEEQIAEAIHVAAMMGLCNRVANAFGLISQELSDLKHSKS
jgi:uncharacterized peroxidase-related enzyme